VQLFKLSTYQRVTSQRFLPEIDGLRFLAIIPVVLMHLNTALKKNETVYADIKHPLNDFFNLGDLGVYVFFAISGFILGLPFAKQHLQNAQPVKLGKYFLRRVTRLEPPYIIVMTALLLMHWLVLHTSNLSNLGEHYAYSLVYLHNIKYGDWSNINPVAWSLEIEIQFYILAPLLTMVFKLPNKHLRRAIFAFVILLMTWFQINYKQELIDAHLHMSFLSHGQYFLIGFLLIDILTYEKLNWQIVGDVLGVIAIFFLFFLKKGPHYYRLIFPFCILLVFVCAFAGKWFNRFFTNKYVSVIGGMCYITYLIHFPLAFLITKFTKHLCTGNNYALDIIIQDIICLPIILIISAVAFAFLEKPFMFHDWPQKFKTWLFKPKAIG
jgi:peptidoglycan/LPS O-acetylase OafA/YrhL